jgi:hypothetical protein
VNSSTHLLQPFVGPWPRFSPWTGDQPVARPLPTRRTAQTQNKCTKASIPQAGFELTIPVFEVAKSVNTLDRAATVIGERELYV